MTDSPNTSVAPNRKQWSIVRKSQIILGAIGAIVTFIGTMPVPEGWFAPHSQASNFWFQIGMTLASPAFKFSKWVGLDRGGVSNSDCVFCVVLVIFNGLLCIPIGTIIGLLIKTLKSKKSVH